MRKRNEFQKERGGESSGRHDRKPDGFRERRHDTTKRPVRAGGRPERPAFTEGRGDRAPVAGREGRPERGEGSFRSRSFERKEDFGKARGGHKEESFRRPGGESGSNDRRSGGEGRRFGEEAPRGRFSAERNGPARFGERKGGESRRPAGGSGTNDRRSGGEGRRFGEEAPRSRFSAERNGPARFGERKGGESRRPAGGSGNNDRRSGGEGRRFGEEAPRNRFPAERRFGERRGEDAGRRGNDNRDAGRGGFRSFNEEEPRSRPVAGRERFERKENYRQPEGAVEKRHRRSEETGRPGPSERPVSQTGFSEQNPYSREQKQRRERPVRESREVTSSEPSRNEATTGLIRLNRYIANAGICSRREADVLIESGQITVNGNVIAEMGYKVLPTDVVKYGKRILNPEKLVYLLLNKPKDFITTTDDPEDRRTVMELVSGACSERVYPVGRLDRNTTGLLLMTNDGELADKLTHPSGNIKKVYQAELDRAVTLEDFEALQAGIELEDGFIKPDALSIVTPDAFVVGIEIHSGRNRIVRRMFEHFGYEVKKLDRTSFAGLTKKDLPRGNWRMLTPKEVVRLKFLL